MELLVAAAVVAILLGLIVAVVRWARGGSAYDDGASQLFVPYVGEPSDDRRDEGGPGGGGGGSGGGGPGGGGSGGGA